MKRELLVGLDQAFLAKEADPLSSGERHLLEMVRQGVLEIRADGSIWRHFKRGRTGRLCRRRPTRADYMTPAGYMAIESTEDGVTYHAMAHRLVWIEKFGPTPLQINHKNGITDENEPDNLEPATGSKNQEHAYRKLGRPVLRGERNGSARLTDKQASEIFGLKGRAKQEDVAKQFGVSRFAVYRIWNGLGWRHLTPSKDGTLPDLDKISLETMRIVVKMLGIKSIKREAGLRSAIQVTIKSAIRDILPQGDPRKDPDYHSNHKA